MLVLTWNMGHRGPGVRRGDPQEQWSLVKEQAPDIVFAQEAPTPSLIDFSGYEIAFSPVSARHIGYVVAIRQTSGRLEPDHMNTHRDDLAVWGQVDGVGRALLVSTRVDSRRNPNHALDRASNLAGDGPFLIAGDFNAGPSMGSTNPCLHAASLGLTEMSHASPEANTIRAPRQAGDHQVDHVFGRGFPAPGRVSILPVAESDGPDWSYHNVVIVELGENAGAGR